MLQIIDGPLQAFCFPTRIEPPGETLVGVVKATLDLRPGEAAALAAEQRAIEGGEEPYADRLGNSIRRDGDVAPFKPRADLLLTGTCHPPEGEATRCDATFQVGTWKKTLAVLGDRQWVEDGRRMTEPRPFRAMPLRWELALGDVESDANPQGHGLRPEAGEDGRPVWPLPNIEYPHQMVTRSGDRPPPAGFGPLGQMHPARARKRGTYDEKWLRRRHPFPPLDIDWSCHNAAPADQQVEGYLAGDEALRLVNLHPAHAVLETRLPGLRPRWFVTVTTPKRTYFFEVELRLDTLWVDADAGQAVLLWRGQAPIPQKRDVAQDGTLFLVETADAPATTREAAWERYRAAVEPPSAEPEPPRPTEAEAAASAEMLDKAVAELRKAGAPDDLLERLAAERDPDRFQEIMFEWLESVVKPE